METIAVVNGEPITLQMLDTAVTRYIIQLEEDEDIDFEPTKENLKYIKTEVLNFLIERILLLKRAISEGTEISNEEVLSNIQSIKSSFGSPEEWQNNLAALRIKEEDLFEEIRNDMIIERFTDNIFHRSIKFGEEELKAYYDENESKMREPDLFTFYETYAGNASEVKAAYNILQKDSSDSNLSKDFKDTGMKLQKHTDIPSYQLSEELYKVFSDTEPGKVASKETEGNGMLIYKLIKKDIGKKLPFDQIKEKLSEFLIKSARQEILSNIIEEEMERAEIEYKDTSYLEG